MKPKILLAALFVAGIATALAVAAPPPGKGNPHKDRGVSTTTNSASSSPSTTSTTTTTAGRKVTLCHKTGNGRFVKITIAKAAVAAHLRHGDHLGNDCSKTTTPTTTAGTGTTTAGTDTTTTVATTTS